MASWELKLADYSVQCFDDITVLDFRQIFADREFEPGGAQLEVIVHFKGQGLRRLRLRFDWYDTAIFLGKKNTGSACVKRRCPRASQVLPHHSIIHAKEDPWSAFTCSSRAFVLHHITP